MFHKNVFDLFGRTTAGRQQHLPISGLFLSLLMCQVSDVLGIFTINKASSPPFDFFGSIRAGKSVCVCVCVCADLCSVPRAVAPGDAR